MADIEELTEENSDFRRVLYTGKNPQLVLMAIQRGEEIGEETHADPNQFFRVEKGKGEVWIDGHRSKIKSDDAIGRYCGCPAQHREHRRQAATALYALCAAGASRWNSAGDQGRRRRRGSAFRGQDDRMRRQFLIGAGTLAITGVGATYIGLRQMGSMDEYAAAVAATRAALSQDPAILEFVRCATLAASGHNTQPWRFRITEKYIDVLPDFSRRTPIVDPDDHHLFASLGCAAENLALAAGARGRPGELSFNEANNGSVVFTFGAVPREDPDLFNAIPKRQSTRADYDGRLVSVADLKALASASSVPGVDLVLITGRPQIDRVRDLVIAGNSAQLADAAFVRELRTWLRFSPREAIEKGDGLFSASSGNPTLPAWLGSRVFDWVFTADTENEKYARHLRTSAGVAVFVSERDDKDHWVRAGRACQRFALQATALGLKHAFINQPVEVANLRPELATLAGLPGRRPDIVMRFGYGSDLPNSARRPVSAVLA